MMPWDIVWGLVVLAAIVAVVIDYRHKVDQVERGKLVMAGTRYGVYPRDEESNAEYRRRIQQAQEKYAGLFANGRRTPAITLRSRRWEE